MNEISPDGSLDASSLKMLQEVGIWMRRNAEVIYGSRAAKSVKLLGHDGALQWKQEADGLAITCPAQMPFATAITFRAE